MANTPAISSESSLIVSILWLIRDLPLVDKLVSLAHDTEGLRRPLGDRKQVVADPFCFIQIDSPANHAIKNGGELCGILGDEVIRRRGLPAFG